MSGFFAAASLRKGLRKTGRLAVVFWLFLFCAGAGKLDVRAQGPIKSTEKTTITPKPKRPSTPRPIRKRGVASEESFNFLVLGDRFFETGKWRAAEAAYRESLRLGNSDAAAALKELNENTRTK